MSNSSLLNIRGFKFPRAYIHEYLDRHIDPAFFLCTTLSSYYSDTNQHGPLEKRSHSKSSTFFMSKRLETSPKIVAEWKFLWHADKLDLRDTTLIPAFTLKSRLLYLNSHRARCVSFYNLIIFTLSFVSRARNYSSSCSVLIMTMEFASSHRISHTSSTHGFGSAFIFISIGGEALCFVLRLTFMVMKIIMKIEITVLMWICGLAMASESKTCFSFSFSVHKSTAKWKTFSEPRKSRRKSVPADIFRGNSISEKLFSARKVNNLRNSLGG